MGKLTAAKVERLKETGTYEDGEGLRLVVKAGGAKSWVFRYQVSGRRREMGLGSHPTVSLKQARIEAAAQRRLILHGQDPVEVRKQLQEIARRQAARVSFVDVAMRYIEAQRAGWRGPKQAPQWISSLSTYAFPIIGHKPPEDITTEDILTILRPIWDAKPETARRVRSRIETILNAAKAEKLCEGENVAAWRGHLELLLTRQKANDRGHHSALPWQQVPEFWQAIKAHTDMSARAVRLTLLTALRTSEVIGAQWGEIDLEAREWTVPAARMKAKKAHKVPLSAAAVKELQALPRIGNSNFLFPGQRGANHMSNLAMLMKVRGMDEMSIAGDGKGWRDAGGRVMTIHGLRSAFRDWAAECSRAPNHVCEMALAHTVGSAVEAAYRRGDLLKKRKALMADWASYATAAPAKNVVRMRRAK